MVGWFVQLELLEKGEPNHVGHLDRLETDARRIEGYAHGELLLRVDDQVHLHVVGFELACLFERIGDLVDDRAVELLLVGLERRVEEENTLDLGDGELGTHVADALDVQVSLACLQQLTSLDDGIECLDGARFDQLRVANPLLQVTRVVAQLDAFRPVAHLLAQYQVVERARANEVE